MRLANAICAAANVTTVNISFDLKKRVQAVVKK